MMDILSLLLQDAFWSALAAMGFALLFNVPRRTIPHCMIAGALGHAIRTLFITQFGFSIEFATLIGAVVIGFWAKNRAYRMKAPSMIFGITGVIPMVPGVFAYQTMIGLLELTLLPNLDAAPALLAEVAVNGIRTGLILGALALGIASPMLIFNRKKPVV